MAYLTENQLKNSVDMPIALPDTTIRQGDYLILSTVKLLAAQRLTLRAMALQLFASSVDITHIDVTNKVVPNLGLAYVVLRQDYQSGVPGASGGLDFLYVDSVGVALRSLTPVVLTTPATYSVIVANNMQSSATSAIPGSTSIDFKLIVTGQWRLELTVA